MARTLDSRKLASENKAHANSGGVSAGSRGLGFTPAFLDVATMTIYASRFADGRPAACHLLDGLPDEVVIKRAASGRVTRAKPTLISGFERGGFFYTRAAAARACKEWGSAE